MKTILTIIALCLTLAACTLNEDPRDQINEEEAYTSKKALFRNAVATLYTYIGGNTDGQGLQGTCRGVYDLQTFGSDEAMLPVRGTDWFDGGIWIQMYCHSWTAGHEIPKNAWLYLYKVVTLCNHSLEKLDEYQELAGSDYDRWQAEVRALRAMYYWYLIDLFGDVPLVTSSDVSMNKVRRESRAKVFQFCVSELEHARRHLSYDNSVREGDYYGRITAPVCCFVLAKLMLNAAVYTGEEKADYYRRCVDYCEDLRRSGYELETFYPNNFIVYNQYPRENIFVIPMDKYIYNNQQQNLFRSYHPRHAAAFGFSGENGSCATLRAMEVFGYIGTKERDHRLPYNYYYGKVSDLSLNEIKDRSGQPLAYHPEAVKLDLSGSPYVETAGARMHKYEVDKNGTNNGKLMDNDIVLFRYADVLLMRAEAMLRLGEDGHDYFDQVRRRVDMPTREYTLQNILDERLLELCWEGWRRQDLIRFGQYRSLYDGPDAIDESDGHTSVYPIPASVIELNSNMVQNKGY